MLVVCATDSLPALSRFLSLNCSYLLRLKSRQKAGRLSVVHTTSVVFSVGMTACNCMMYIEEDT